VGEATATNLYQESYRSVEDVAKANVDELTQVKGISEEKAAKLIEDAKKHLQDDKVKEAVVVEEKEEKGPEEGGTDGEG
jgi:transcription termination factor NusA